MKSDSDIKKDVEDELRWDPDIDDTDIGVSVKNGVVTLSGFVRSYSQKKQAEADAKRVSGVMGVANDIEVHLPVFGERADPEIARDAISSLRTQLPYTADFLKVTVSKGYLTLEGNVEWNYQRERAEDAVRRVRGVKGVINAIVIQPHASPVDVKRKIEDALKRNAEVDANNITVETHGGEVILQGRVRSWAERQEAEKAAWLAPGVVKVDNRIALGL